MRRISILFILIAIIHWFGCCQMNKKHLSRQQTSTSFEKVDKYSDYSFHQFREDSNTRWFYLWSDSPFVYLQDSVLYVKGGKLISFNFQRQQQIQSQEQKEMETSIHKNLKEDVFGDKIQRVAPVSFTWTKILCIFLAFLLVVCSFKYLYRKWIKF